MTVRDLIDMLSSYDEDARIVIAEDTDSYGFNPGRIACGYGVRTFWGKDFSALVLTLGEQIGCISDEFEEE